MTWALVEPQSNVYVFKNHTTIHEFYSIVQNSQTLNHYALVLFGGQKAVKDVVVGSRGNDPITKVYSPAYGKHGGAQVFH